jgi:hypothetical protein
MVKALEEKGLLRKICSNSVDQIPLEDWGVQRLLAGRSLQDKEFFCAHGYWAAESGSKKLKLLESGTTGWRRRPSSDTPTASDHHCPAAKSSRIAPLAPLHIGESGDER